MALFRRLIKFRADLMIFNVHGIVHIVPLLLLFAIFAAPAVAQPDPEAAADPEAELFMQRCFQCHTGLLTGRELVNTHQRSEENLRDTVYRMQQYAGMLTEEQVDALVSLMKDQSFVFRIEEAKLEADANATTDETSPDQYASLFVKSCAICHTIGGGNIPGGDLTHTKDWDAPRLSAAVARMQDRVGPLTPEQIEGLTTLLKDPEVLPRIKRSGYISTAPTSTPSTAGQDSTGTAASPSSTASQTAASLPAAAADNGAHSGQQMPMGLIYGMIIFTLVAAIGGYFIFIRGEE